MLSCPDLNISKDSNPKAEKVVNPPKTPNDKNSFTGHSSELSMPMPLRHPKRKQPKKFITNVFRGNASGEYRAASHIPVRYRQEAPMKPPKPTKITVFI